MSATASLGLVTACDGGSDATPTTASTTTNVAEATTTTADASSLSSDQFVTQANAICTAGNAEIEALFADVPPGTEPSSEQQATLQVSLLDNVEQQVDDIESLGVPANLTSTVGPFLAGARTTIEQGRAASPEEFFSAGNPFATVNELATAAGLDACGA
jgi:hypothetical protein